MKSILFKSFNTLFLVLSAAYLIPGQTNAGVVKGSLLDQNGSLVSGAKVTLTRVGIAGNGAVRQTTTNYEGEYSFSDVAHGEYEIEVTTNWINKSLRKRVTITSSELVQTNLVISLEPCSDEEEATGMQDKLTDIDRAEIVRELINLKFPKPAGRVKDSMPKIIFSNDNISIDWLNPEQKGRIAVMTRMEIQDLTEKTGGRSYFSVAKMTRRGGCVSVTLLENVTVKGQLEDANMAGGGTSYEFSRVNGRWTGRVFASWIS